MNNDDIRDLITALKNLLEMTPDQRRRLADREIILAKASRFDLVVTGYGIQKLEAPQKNNELTSSQARMLEIMWQGTTPEAREKLDKEQPEVKKLIEEALGRSLEIA